MPPDRIVRLRPGSAGVFRRFPGGERRLSPLPREKRPLRRSGQVQYRRAKTVVLYVSKELEVDTRRLIKRAWKDGKRVAAPRCVENTRLMNMHLIRSMDDLQEGAFGILEPNENLPILHDTRDAICIVPAFCNDFRGYRVGYGGGYYDRYLSSFSGAKIGVNFSDCVRPRLISGRYDVPVDLLVTDRYIRRCTQQKSGSRHRRTSK